jgi:HAD superfamily hydrolase (TIGR01484 family)
MAELKNPQKSVIRPLAAMPPERLNKIDYLLTDIDDTMTLDGRLPSSSLAALERLEEAGIGVVPITGRPAGWCEHIARMWSVKAVVGENGAFYYSYDRRRHTMIQFYAKSASERLHDRARLDQIRERILREVPGAGIASDQGSRVADLAIDFCEDVEPLSTTEIDHIVRIFQEGGAVARISSIHVNGWFGSYDKLTMTRACLLDLFAVDIDSENGRIAFIGDSPNDDPMFNFFDNSVGVANVLDFSPVPQPKWITVQTSAKGFQEFSERLLQARLSAGKRGN